MTGKAAAVIADMAGAGEREEWGVVVVPWAVKA
ncbi:hypothetical protein LCGC14_2192030, partial [marine sediment metagenome]